MRKPRQDKRESELSEAAVQHLAEEANAIDEGDERLGIEPSKPSKMVLDRFLEDAAVVARELSTMKQTSERNVSSGASGVLEPSDLSRPITIKVHPKNEEGDSVRDESSRETEHERLTPPKEVDEVDEARVTCPSEHRINGGSQATSVVGGTSTDGRGTYASWWRSGKYSQAGAMSYPRSPSEIEEEEATCGYCCARLFCLVSKGNDRNGSMKSGMSKR